MQPIDSRDCTQSSVTQPLTLHVKLGAVWAAASLCLHRPTALSAMLVPHLLQKRAHVQGKHLQPHSGHSGAGAGAAGVVTGTGSHGATGSHSRGRRQPGNHAGGALGMRRGGRWSSAPWSPRGSSMPKASDVQNAALCQSECKHTQCHKIVGQEILT